MKSRRSTIWKVALLVLLGLGLLAGLQLLVWHRHASETFERHARDPQLHDTTSERYKIRRPALFEPVEPGDAGEAYAPILAIMTNFPGKWAYPNPSEAEHAQLLVAARPILEGLRKAQSTETLTFPPSLDAKGDQDFSFTRGLMGSGGILIRIAGGYHEQKKDAEALEALILHLGVIADLKKTPGHALLPMQWGFGEEGRSYSILRGILQKHSVSAAALARTRAQLDRIGSAWAPLYPTVKHLGSHWRRQLLYWEREGYPGFPSPSDARTSWRYAFSAHLGRATALNQVESAWKALEALENLPSAQWKSTLDPILNRERSEAIRWPLDEVQSLYARETEVLMGWSSLRVALAVAQFEVEQGALPVALADLVPKYLESLPPCPAGGEDLRYRAGSISCGHTSSLWKVRSLANTPQGNDGK